MAKAGIVESPSGDIARDLLAWYDRHGRRLAWRARGGTAPDPYRVWLSEIMLQQTTTTAVAPYYRDFLARWSGVHDLAAATLDQVLAAWAGLGYYARARNLHRCARVVAGDLGGRFPDTEAELRRLPGIGPYTAAAVAAIAFDRPATVVDGNVERVMARFHALETPLPAAKGALRALAGRLTPTRRPGDYAQAMMDLGATVCLPRTPRCGACPIAEGCAGRRAGIAEALPRRAPKAARPTRRGVVFWTIKPDGALLLRRRPESGLLGGMMEVPSTAWRAAEWREAEALAHAPVAADWTHLPGLVRHTFTHFYLELTVWAGCTGAELAADGRWVRLDDLADLALPSIMRKVVRHALSSARPAASGAARRSAPACPRR